MFKKRKSIMQEEKILPVKVKQKHGKIKTAIIVLSILGIARITYEAIKSLTSNENWVDITNSIYCFDVKDSGTSKRKASLNDSGDKETIEKHFKHIEDGEEEVYFEDDIDD